MSEPTLCSIYRLRVVLNGVSPLVWRRLLVSSETNLADLHEILQLAFGWSGFYLYEFRIHGRTFGRGRVQSASQTFSCIRVNVSAIATTSSYFGSAMCVWKRFFRAKGS